MKTFDLFIVELEKTVNDTITTDSGLELYIETKFENSEFDHRVTQGPVVAVPFKYDTGVSVGDTLYFHHLVVMQEGQVLTGVDNHYFVQYGKQAIGNQAFAYKSKETGEIKCLGGWSRQWHRPTERVLIRSVARHRFRAVDQLRGSPMKTRRFGIEFASVLW